jgi:hypothetical protein
LVLALLVAPAFAAERDPAIPDLDVTPGVIRDLSLQQICTTKWGRDARAVTAAMKRQVFDRDGIACRPLFGKSKKLPQCGKWEIDHSCSRELGGADVPPNLWAQRYKGAWNARLKDRLENRLHKEACSENITLAQAQHDICKTDWRIAYRKYFGEPK